MRTAWLVSEGPHPNRIEYSDGDKSKNFSEVEYCAQPKGWVKLGLTLLDLTSVYMTSHVLILLELTYLDLAWTDLT